MLRYLAQEAVDGHKPARPEWNCGTCFRTWPCDPAKARLRERYGRDRIGLSIEMADQLFIATADLYLRLNRTDINPTELHARFIAWTR
ncbi:hypothetical protein AB0J86_33215 [Micromonospora sp. NPDC049559]|uniref:hypothetical protein n=1 Tax=Micromonospora sp. NPDC049559 TaxID=3155923 RepID=UPI00341E28ED